MRMCSKYANWRKALLKKCGIKNIPTSMMIKIDSQTTYILHEHLNMVEYIAVDDNMIMMPAYNKMISLTSNILKQIVLFLYEMLFSEKITFQKLDYDNIYIMTISKPKNMKYSFNEKQYKFVTDKIVKIDISDSGIQKTHVILPQHYRKLYMNIYNLMPDNSLKEFMLSFMNHDDDNRIVHPMKILDTILTTIVMS
jgi:hypothetical protein